jgi:hypothetical protein
MGISHGARAPPPGFHRDARWSPRSSHACGRDATRPARACATEGPGIGEVPGDGGDTRYTSARGTARGNVRTARGRGWPPARGHRRPAASGRGGEHTGACYRAIARETLSCAAQTWEVGAGSTHERAKAGVPGAIDVIPSTARSQLLLEPLFMLLFSCLR